MSAYGSDRESRVASLTAQYRNGSYQPNSLATSQGMVSEALAAGIK
jgi:hypothetical protein